MSGTEKKIPLVGLLGGIGSGKSTVARLLAARGCSAIDVDAIAHQVLETAEVREMLHQRFGRRVFAADGRIDRGAIARIVFSKAEELKWLNSVIHPRTFERVQEAISAIRSAGKAKAIIIDAPLLVEAGWDKQCDVLVFVECDTSNRLSRLQTYRALDAEQMKARENFQISLDKKAALAYYSIDNNADFSALESQVGSVFSKITGIE